MKEIFDFTQRFAEYLPSEDIISTFFFDRGELYIHASLPIALIEEVKLFQNQISAIIPADILYRLNFDDLEPKLYLSLDWDMDYLICISSDGAGTLIEILQQYDWEEIRQELREQSEPYDNLEDDDAQFEEAGTEGVTEPAPPKAPSVPSLDRSIKLAKKIYSTEVKEWVRDIRKDAARSHVLYMESTPDLDEELDDPSEYASDRPNLGSESYTSFAALLSELARMFSDGQIPVSIVTNGKPLSTKDLDTLNAQARAKAWKSALE